MQDAFYLSATTRSPIDYLEHVPLDDRSPGVLQGLLPVLEAGLVLLVLAPAQLNLADGVPAADQIVVANLYNSQIKARNNWKKRFDDNKRMVAEKNV